MPHPLAEKADERDGFRFRGGHPAIDLTATLQARLKPVPRELLNAPQDLSRWLVAAGLTKTLPAATQDDLVTAHQLREAIFALAGNLHDPVSTASAARKTLNRIASQAAAVPALQPDGSVRLSGPVSGLLVTLARDAIVLFGSDQSARIKQCQSPTCTLFFIDDSRKGVRRWCSMSACGNKAKIETFRKRQQASKNQDT